MAVVTKSYVLQISVDEEGWDEERFIPNISLYDEEAMDSFEVSHNTYDLDGLQNFVRNIKPTMMRMKDGEDLTDGEKNRIVQFYLEVANIIM